MSSGPCGYEFREAFSCFHYSEADPKGSDCFEAFKDMQECMVKFPDLYGNDNDDESDDIIDLSNMDQQSADTKNSADTSSKTERSPEEQTKDNKKA